MKVRADYGHNTYSYKKARIRYKAECEKQGLPCALCGRPIDYKAKKGERFSFELDHIIPVSRGGALLYTENWQPTHAHCNWKAHTKLDKKAFKKKNKIKINKLKDY